MTDAFLPVVPRRELGRSGEVLSALSFGSMRMLERGLDVTGWCSLLAKALARGVSTFHSSDEYESFPCFAEVWRSLRASLGAGRVQHVIKLAEPHFGHDRFDANRLGERVDSYLSALGLDRIDVVQWMWRGDLKDEPARLERMATQLPDISDAFDRLRQAGKLGAVATFPYTFGCAELLLGKAWNAGFALYVNSFETEMLTIVERSADAGQGTVALRPLAAGRAATTPEGPAGALAWALAKPGVSTGVVSFSSTQHLDELIGAFG